MNAGVGMGGVGRGQQGPVTEGGSWLWKKRFYSVNLILPAQGTYSKRSAWGMVASVVLD